MLKINSIVKHIFIKLKKNLDQMLKSTQNHSKAKRKSNNFIASSLVMIFFSDFLLYRDTKRVNKFSLQFNNVSVCFSLNFFFYNILLHAFSHIQFFFNFKLKVYCTRLARMSVLRQCVVTIEKEVYDEKSRRKALNARENEKCIEIFLFSSFLIIV